ncbi:MAG: DHH family phosphoesterase [Phycisphaerales bacterium]|nr:DHH family phosphoesterase [Phycisphaerales bacterium]
MTWTSTATEQDIAVRLAAASSIVCITHAKPDGDAMGSVLALVRALQGTCDVQGICVGPVPEPLLRLVGDTAITTIAADGDPPSGHPDLIVVVDTGAWSQLGVLAPWVKAAGDAVVVIDHHASGDADMAATRLVDSSAASATMLVMRVVQAMGIDLGRGDFSVAEALFAGLATDTGWFRQANADAAAFAAAATLLAHDVDKNGLHRTIEETARPHRLALQSRLLSSIEWVAGGRGALMFLREADFTETGGRRDELTGLVNAPLVVDGVEFSVMLVEDPAEGVKLSLRSKPPRTPGGDFVNVRDLAGHLGGGGHVHASGARCSGSLADARDAVLAAMGQLGLPEA